MDLDQTHGDELAVLDGDAIGRVHGQAFVECVVVYVDILRVVGRRVGLNVNLSSGAITVSAPEIVVHGNILAVDDAHRTVPGTREVVTRNLEAIAPEA